MSVVAVAKRQHGVARAGERRAGRLLQRLCKGFRPVRRITLAIGAGDHGEAPALRQRLEACASELYRARLETPLPRRLGKLLCKAFRRAGLRRVQHGELGLGRNGLHWGRRDARRKQTREKAVQPCALRRRERRTLREQGDRSGRAPLDDHGATSAAIARSWSISILRAKLEKLSAMARLA